MCTRWQSLPSIQPHAHNSSGTKKHFCSASAFVVEAVSSLLETNGLTSPFWLCFSPLFLVKTPAYPPAAELL